MTEKVVAVKEAVEQAAGDKAHFQLPTAQLSNSQNQQLLASDVQEKSEPTIVILNESQLIADERYGPDQSLGNLEKSLKDQEKPEANSQSVTYEFNRQTSGSQNTLMKPQVHRKSSRDNSKYTYFLPVQVGPNGQIELPASIAKQLKIQAAKSQGSAENSGLTDNPMQGIHMSEVTTGQKETQPQP